MRKSFLIASAAVLLGATGLFMTKPTPTAATQFSASPSAFEMMSAAANLPVAPASEAI